MFPILSAAVLCAFHLQDPSGQDPQDPGAPARVVRPEPLPIPRAVALARGEGRIVVDGSLQDWPSLPPIPLDDVRQVSGTAPGVFRSLDDLAGKLFVLWDADDLYVAARVLDDWHIALRKDTPRNSEIPPADSLLVTIDPLRDTQAFGFDPGRSEDVEFWLGEVEGQERRVVKWDRFRGQARHADGAVAIVTHDEEARITTYEARIPWREILPHGHAAHAGMVVDAQFVLSDYDEPTDPLPQTRIGWNFGMGPRIDHWLLGSLMLLDAPADGADVTELRLPEFPPPAKRDEVRILDQAGWIGLKTRLDREPAVLVTPEVPDPAFAGGSERHDALVELERRVAEHPRVDFLEFQQRIHRRMTRECAGIVRQGLPYFWDSVLDGMVRRAAAAPPESGMRLFRLPQGGWLVRSEAATFAIDPAGFRLDHELLEQLDFVLLTRPLEITERNDQLLARMAATRPPKPVFTHVALHLPGLDVREVPLVVPGSTYDAGEVEVRVLGEADEENGLVPRSVGYHVIWPDGTDLVASGSDLQEELVRPEGGGLDVLILSARHPRARIVGQRVDAEVTVLDDVLECAVYPGALARVPLQHAWQLQEELRPRASLLMAPGESVELAAGR